MERKINSWIYESKIRSILKRKNEMTYSDLLNMCDMSRTKFNNHLMGMLSDEIVEKVKRMDLRYTYYKITEKGIKCLKEDSKIMDSLNKIEGYRSSK